jgi:hypothetical protein
VTFLTGVRVTLLFAAVIAVQMPSIHATYIADIFVVYPVSLSKVQTTGVLLRVLFCIICLHITNIVFCMIHMTLPLRIVVLATSSTTVPYDRFYLLNLILPHPDIVAIHDPTTVQTGLLVVTTTTFMTVPCPAVAPFVRTLPTRFSPACICDIAMRYAIHTTLRADLSLHYVRRVVVDAAGII